MPLTSRMEITTKHKQWKNEILTFLAEIENMVIVVWIHTQCKLITACDF